MRTITKRFMKLEEHRGLGPGTDKHRLSRERMEGFKPRIGADRVSRGLPPEDPDALKPEDLAGLSLVQILRRRFSRKPLNTMEGSATERKVTRLPDVR